MKSPFLYYLIIQIAIAASTPAHSSPISANHVEYETYQNSRYEFMIEFPRKLLIPRGESDNGDGQIFISRDQTAKLVAFGKVNLDFEVNRPYTIKTAYAKELQSFKNQGKRQVTLKVQKENWYVLSGFEGKNIFYCKTYCLKDTIITFEITYPAAQRELWDTTINRLSKSFTPMQLDTSR